MVNNKTQSKTESKKLKKQKCVNILMSTFNGSEYIDQQMESILSQSHDNLSVLVRDDGSTDVTYEKLLEYQKKYKNIKILEKGRLGVVKSFMRLLIETNVDAPFYAFSDQDDYWKKDKIEKAIYQIEKYSCEIPVLYFSRLEYVDSKLNHLGFSKIYKKNGFENALIENIVTGCTIVINKKAKEKICEWFPNYLIMHDWWCYLVISAFGKVIYDKHANIKYRLHGKNLVGLPTNKIEKVKRLFGRYFDYDKSGIRASDQAIEFYKGYFKQLNDKKKAELIEFLKAKFNPLSRLRYIKRRNVWKQSFYENIFFNIRIIVGRF